MSDQAQRLRELVKEKQQHTNSRIITISSGKGGVGKSFLTVNLALALTGFGLNVLVIDADFGLANIDIMLGTASTYNFKSVLAGEKTLREIIQEGRYGVRFISGGNGLYELIHMDEFKLNRLLKGMEELDDIADIILVDTGAGINDNIMQLVMAGTEVIVITTPEPTSLVDAYALIKVITEAKYQAAIHLVMNRTHNHKEAENAIKSLSMVVSKNLSRELRPLGYIAYDGEVSKTISQFTPILVKHPKSAASQDIGRIAERLMELHTDAEAKVRKNNLSRFLSGLVR